MKEKIIAIFDIGRTNKKLLLFDFDLNCLSDTEEKFPEIVDEDGFKCDDIDKIEKWITGSIHTLLKSEDYDLTAVSFAAYGATLVYLDKDGKRLTPLYNYLKPLNEKIPEKIYRRNGGQNEFCRRTASPALGMLNSGMQALWLKTEKPQIFLKVADILHLPQYLSYIITGKIFSEHTSIGCHTALWDFDKMEYHSWIRQEGINLPDPVPAETLNEVTIDGKKLLVGIGIYDSSSSLVPYIKGNTGKFILVSTGTWCINMNPFNSENLTYEEVDNGCLCYMSVNRQAVKSSRFFLGNLHEKGVGMLSKHFKVPADAYKQLKYNSETDKNLKIKYSGKRIFFKPGKHFRELMDKVDLYEFNTFNDGYYQLLNELGEMTVDTLKLIIPDNDETENIYITGGFSDNPFFSKYLMQAFPSKKVYSSVLKNATALGAALVILEKMHPEKALRVNLGLKSC